MRVVWSRICRILILHGAVYAPFIDIFALVCFLFAFRAMLNAETQQNIEGGTMTMMICHEQVQVDVLVCAQDETRQNGCMEWVDCTHSLSVMVTTCCYGCSVPSNVRWQPTAPTERWFDSYVFMLAIIIVINVTIIIIAGIADLVALTPVASTRRTHIEREWEKNGCCDIFFLVLFKCCCSVWHSTM